MVIDAGTSVDLARNFGRAGDRLNLNGHQVFKIHLGQIGRLHLCQC